MPDVEEAWAFAESFAQMHVECCFKAPRGKKEESRQECVRDMMAAVRDVALAAHDDACRRCNRFGFDEPPCEKRARIQALAEGRKE